MRFSTVNIDWCMRRDVSSNQHLHRQRWWVETCQRLRSITAAEHMCCWPKVQLHIFLLILSSRIAADASDAFTVWDMFYQTIGCTPYAHFNLPTCVVEQF